MGCSISSSSSALKPRRKSENLKCSETGLSFTNTGGEGTYKTKSRRNTQRKDPFAAKKAMDEGEMCLSGSGQEFKRQDKKESKRGTESNKEDIPLAASKRPMGDSPGLPSQKARSRALSRAEQWKDGADENQRSHAETKQRSMGLTDAEFITGTT